METEKTGTDVSKKMWCLMSSLFLFSLTSVANAGAILSATSGVINSGGPGFGTLTETFNQAGLSSGYVSGVTDFDTYIATNPLHTVTFGGFEWFGETDTTSASVTYSLGAVYTLDGFALWNEESAGIGLLDLLYSTDNVNFSPLLAGLSPTDHPVVDYGADVYSFSSVSAQYIRLDMSRCPQQDPGAFPSCAIGEVAFRQGEDVPAPAPATLALFGVGLAGLGWARRRKA